MFGALRSRVGEGATSVVWRVEHAESGQTAALKLSTTGSTLLRRGRRSSDDSGADGGLRYSIAASRRTGAPTSSPSGPEGGVVDPRAIDDPARERIAAVVAHGVGRALAELHEASVRHGDVKPANILLRAGTPSRDAADDRRATLIDLGFAADVAEARIQGLTPRYAPPETTALGDPGPAGDLWALGLVLAEILDSKVASSDDPRAEIAAWGGHGEIARWIQALVAPAPGARPSAAWIATRSARWLDLERDDLEDVSARDARVRRAYIAVRRRDLHAGVDISPEITGPTRAWLDDAIAWTCKLEAPIGGAPIEPLRTIDKARWLTALVGTSAAAWPLDDVHESTLGARLVSLAREAPPEAWTRRDVLEGGAPTAWEAGEGGERIGRLVAELARPAPNDAAIAIAEDDVARGCAPRALTVALVEALVRTGEIGRAWASVTTLGDAEVMALRAEIARRSGDRDGARSAATIAKEHAREPARSRARATLARLAWDTGDFDAAERELSGAVGAAAAEGRALVAYGRGQYDLGLEGLDGADTSDADGAARLDAARGMLEHARGGSIASAGAFARAAAGACRSGAVVDEATYLTSEAAAAVDAGDVARGIVAASRAALLWERLGQQTHAARVWLARAAAPRDDRRPTRRRPGGDGGQRTRTGRG